MHARTILIICTRVDLTQGQGGLVVNPKTKHRRIIQPLSIKALTITRWAARNADSCDVKLLDEPSSLWMYTGGVHINGKKWKVGTPFFYRKNENRDPSQHSFGTIEAMIHWQDRFATTMIIKVNRYRLHNDGLQFWVAPEPDMTPIMIYWSQITWRCHLSDHVRNGRPMKSVVRVSTTRPTMDGIDFDGYM
jgi:hypothetical protein